MVDSFRHLFPEIEVMAAIRPDEGEHYIFLSNVLIKLIDRHIFEITEEFARDMETRMPGISPLIEHLKRLNLDVLRGVQYWLKRGTDTLGIEEFVAAGNRLRELGVPLPEVITAMALSRKSLWMRTVRERIFSTPLEIYTTLEFNNRIIFFYDKINYYLASGYMKSLIS
jgi:hypothetical protein